MYGVVSESPMIYVEIKQLSIQPIHHKHFLMIIPDIVGSEHIRLKYR